MPSHHTELWKNLDNVSPPRHNLSTSGARLSRAFIAPFGQSSVEKRDGREVVRAEVLIQILGFLEAVYFVNGSVLAKKRLPVSYSPSHGRL